MKSFAFAALLGYTYALSELESTFLSYISAHGKSYPTLEEYEKRLEIFTSKDELI